MRVRGISQNIFIHMSSPRYISYHAILGSIAIASSLEISSQVVAFGLVLENFA